MASSFSFLTLLVLLCIYMSIGTMAFTMRLIQRVNFDTLLFPKNISLEEKHNRIVQLSKTHALKYLINNTKEISPQTFQPSVSNIISSNLYAVEMMIGTPPFKTLLVLDTGSSDTWVQCDGCKKCFPLKGGNFKYRESKTFKEVSCDDPLCVPKICSSGKCLYDITYADGTKSKGNVSSETFTFPPNSNNVIIDKRVLSFKGVVFGCGLENEKFTVVRGPQTNDNNIGGIFGIGIGPRSFLKQLIAETNMRFSYCLSLPQIGQSQHPQSYLHFGSDAKINGAFKTTQLVTTIGNQRLTHYYVVCKGISLGVNKLPIDPKLFELKPDITGGFLFDTGSVVTYLAGSAYNVLKQHVNNYFNQKYGLHPYTEEKFFLDLCYLNVPSNVVKPSMTYHFDGGADFVVDPNSLFLSFQKGRVNLLCLAVVGKDDRRPNIMGSIHQAGHTILFDVGKNQVSFVPQAQTCSNA